MVEPAAAHRPAALNWVLAGSVVSVLLLAGLPTLLILDRDGTVTSIVRDQPGLSPDDVDFAFVAAVGYTVVLHSASAVLLIWFTIKVLAGRGWARFALTGYLLVATGFSLISAGQGQQYLVVVIASDAIHVAMLILLWMPAGIQSFFAAHRWRADARPATTRDDGSPRCRD